MKLRFVLLFLIMSYGLYAQETNNAIEAAKSGDEKQLLDAIKSGADINTTDAEGVSVLAYAVLEDNYKLVKKLLKLNATVDASAIVASAQVNNQKVVKQFQKAGFDINAKDANGNTPLFHALKTGNMDLFNFFIDAGADQTITDINGNSTLLYAIENNMEEGLIESLAKNKSLLNQANNLGQTPFLLALTKENAQLISFLMNNGADVNVQTASGLSPLWFALENNNMVLFQQFAEKGANVNSLRNGQTPLTYALKQNNRELITTLLNYGADPSIDNAEGQTPLAMTLQSNQQDLMNQFLQKTSNINQPNRYGYTLLDQAFQYSSSTMIKTLMSQGAQFGPAQQKNKITPLMYAIEYKKNDLIYELIESSTINQENFYGKTALILAIEQGDLNLVNELIRRGANVNYQNYLGNAPIGYAVAHNQQGIVRQLISSGANVNTYNQYGSTPLIEAAYYNLPQIASLLITAGADRNFRANYGDNAFDVAQKLGNQEVLAVLSR